GVDGTLNLGGGTENTPTPTAGTPTGPAITLTAAGTTLTATLTTAGMMIAGTQNDITFPAGGPVKDAGDGTPDCTVNSAIKKGGTSFAFLPSGCSGTACTGLRALVLALNNTLPIPNGSVLYTCNLNVTATTGTLTYIIEGNNVGGSDSAGNSVDVVGVNGSL